MDFNDILSAKASLHNEEYPDKLVSIVAVKTVFLKGLIAAERVLIPNISDEALAMARVNKFLKMVSGGKVSDCYRELDGEILNGHWTIGKPDSFASFSNEDLALAQSEANLLGK